MVVDITLRISQDLLRRSLRRLAEQNRTADAMIESAKNAEADFPTSALDLYIRATLLACIKFSVGVDTPPGTIVCCPEREVEGTFVALGVEPGSFFYKNNNETIKDHLDGWFEGRLDD